MKGEKYEFRGPGTQVAGRNVKWKFLADKKHWKETVYIGAGIVLFCLNSSSGVFTSLEGSFCAVSKKYFFNGKDLY